MNVLNAIQAAGLSAKRAKRSAHRGLVRCANRLKQWRVIDGKGTDTDALSYIKQMVAGGYCCIDTVCADGATSLRLGCVGNNTFLTLKPDEFGQFLKLALQVGGIKEALQLVKA